MPKKEQHVVPYDGGQWAVRSAGADRITSVHPTQGAAEDAARSIARRNHTEVVTHDRHGRIRDKDSYGNDPFPLRDRKH